MVMVRVSGVLLGIGMLMLSGCIIGHPPTLANTFDVPIEVILRYDDGEISNITVEPGMLASAGKKYLKNDSGKAIAIRELVIKEAGQLLHQFNAEEVRLLIEKENSDWGWWCIDRETVYLVQREHYRDYREGCSRSKLLWTWENGRFYKGSRESP